MGSAMIKVVTYNIHGGIGMDGQQNYSRIGRMLAERNVDIALLQEVDTRCPDRKTEQDIHDLCAGHFSQLVPSPALYTPEGWYGNAVLTRYPVRFSQSIDVSYSNRQPRNIQELIIDTEFGPLHLLNTHKGLKRLERREQIERLSLHIRELKSDNLPLLVGGDFNEWQIFSSRIRNVNRLLRPHGVGATFPTRWPIFKLDRIWSRPAALVKNATVIKTPETRLYSDHFPIEATLDIAGLKVNS